VVFYGLTVIPLEEGCQKIKVIEAKKLKEKSFSFEIFVVGLVYSIVKNNFYAIKC
jgi:hypothetical protein